MLRLNVRRYALGQVAPPMPYSAPPPMAPAPPAYPGYYPPYGYPSGVQYRPIDPLLKAGLESAGVVLSTSDPDAAQTVQLLERIIAAPGFTLPGQPPSGGPAKASELNPILSAVAWSREHAWLTLFLALGVPVIAYLVGRRS